MSKTAIKIKDYYEKGYWTAKMVRNAYEKGKITLEEYNWIIGDDQPQA